MELHYATMISSILAKKLWTFVKVSFFMTRKRFISKKKLVTDFNLLIKKGRRSLSNLLSLLHHHHYSSCKGLINARRYGISISPPQDYEFSCTNSPNPTIFPHFSNLVSNKYGLNHYYCMNPPLVTDQDRHEEGDSYDAASSEKKMMMGMSPFYSPLSSSVKISDYLSGDEEEGNTRVDDEAEEFIRRFYEQLRAQTVATRLLQY